MDSYYTLRITFHPEPKVEQKLKFTTRDEAEKIIQAFGKKGQCWMIVQESQGNYDWIKCIRFGG